MRVPALFSVIVLGMLNPAVPWAATGSTAHSDRVSSARSPSAQRSAALNRTAPNRGHFTPYKFKTGAAPGSSASAVGRRASTAPVLGGRPGYDAKKGAVIGGAPMGRRR